MYCLVAYQILVSKMVPDPYFRLSKKVSFQCHSISSAIYATISTEF